MQYDRELLENLPYFNIYESIESYGFDLNSFIENGFGQFIQHTYLSDFIEFRKAYIVRDFVKVRFYAHKFKGSFSLLCSSNIESLCLKMQKKLDSGSIEVEDIYVDIVQNMNVFLNKIIEFGKKLKNPVDKSLLKLFRYANDECDNSEDLYIKQKLSGENVTSADITKEKTINKDEAKINNESEKFYQGHEPSTGACCNYNYKNCKIL